MSTQRPSLTTLTLALATGPLLLGVLALRSLSETFTSLGQASEELFRGDRLPILNVPIPPISSASEGPEAGESSQQVSSYVSTDIN